MTTFRTLLDALDHHARHPREDVRRGFYNPQLDRVDWMTYGEFAARSLGIGSYLADRGVRAGDVCLLAALSPGRLPMAFLGAVAIGALPMVVAPTKAAKGSDGEDAALARLASMLPSRVFAFTEARSAASPAFIAQGVPTIALPEGGVPPREEMQGRGPDVRPEDAAFLQATSASTGSPKAIRISHANVLSNVAAIRVASRCHEVETVCSWLPLYHDMGLVGTELFSLCNGYSLASMTPFDFLKRPDRWLRVISDCRCTLSPAPNFAYEYAADHVREDRIRGVDLSSWRVAYNGAEPIRERSMRKFVDRFGPAGFRAEAFCPCYGLAEATLAVSMTHAARSPNYLIVAPGAFEQGARVQIRGRGDLSTVTRSLARDELVVFSCGRAVAATTVRLAADGGRISEEELTLGEVVVRGPSVTGDGSAGGSGELFTGDLGFLFEGEAFIVERLKNILIVNGENIAANVLEEQLARHLGISDQRIVSLETAIAGDQARIVAVIEAEAADLESLLPRAPVGAALMAPVSEILWVPKRSIPRTTSGKKQHFMLRRLLEDRRIPVIASTPLNGAGT